jgi:hypothetical protein
MPSPSHSRPMPVASKDRGWDADAAKSRVAKWASSGGSGDKDKIDWGKYGKAFAYYESGADKFGDFKYPHHDIINGKLTLIPRGLYAAQVRYSQFGGPSEIQSHLSAHYRQELKEKPPKAKSSMPAIYQYVLENATA